MDDHLEQHDDLAMRHVLGGLDGDEATSFRQHLLGCGTCRRRVVELRGIASDLQQVDRRERATLAALRTEAPPETEDTDAAPDGEDDDVPPSVRRSERLLGIALVVGVLMVVGLAFWNLHLRSREAVLFDTIEGQQTVLELMVEGRPVATERGDGVRGSVVVDDGRYAIDVSGITAEPGQRLALWFYDDAAELLAVPSADYGPASALPDGGLFASSGQVGGAARLVLSIEDTFDLRRGPTGEVVVEAVLVTGAAERGTTD